MNKLQFNMNQLQCYLVGGAVRDQLLGLPIKERDWVVVGSTPEQMQALEFSAVGHSFPVFLHPQTHEEYALARTERKQGQGYHGFECFADQSVTLEQDLSRRDLSINAIAADAQNNLIDPFHGQADIQERCLRHVSEAFIEDPLRVLRVARFRAQLGQFDFHIHPQTLQLMKQMCASGELQHLTQERIWKEIHKALLSNFTHLFWQTLAEVGALAPVLPIFSALKLDSDRWNKSLHAVEQSTLATQNYHTNKDHHTNKNHEASDAHPRRAEIRFASWCHLLTKSEISALRKQVKAPHAFLDYAQLLALLTHERTQITDLSGDHLWLLLKTLNVQRKSERFADLLLCLNAIDNHCPAAAYLQQAAALLDTVDIPALMQQKITGAELGYTIKQKSIALLNQLRSDYSKKLTLN